MSKYFTQPGDTLNNIAARAYDLGDSGAAGYQQKLDDVVAAIRKANPNISDPLPAGSDPLSDGKSIILPQVADIRSRPPHHSDRSLLPRIIRFPLYLIVWLLGIIAILLWTLLRPPEEVPFAFLPDQLINQGTVDRISELYRRYNLLILWVLIAASYKMLLLWSLFVYLVWRLRLPVTDPRSIGGRLRAWWRQTNMRYLLIWLGGVALILVSALFTTRIPSLFIDRVSPYLIYGWGWLDRLLSLIIDRPGHLLAEATPRLIPWSFFVLIIWLFWYPISETSGKDAKAAPAFTLTKEQRERLRYLLVWVVGVVVLFPSASDLVQSLVPLGAPALLRFTTLMPLVVVWTVFVFLLFLYRGDKSFWHDQYLAPYRGVWTAFSLVIMLTFLTGESAYQLVRARVVGDISALTLARITVGHLTTSTFLTRSDGLALVSRIDDYRGSSSQLQSFREEVLRNPSQYPSEQRSDIERRISPRREQIRSYLAGDLLSEVIKEANNAKARAVDASSQIKIAISRRSPASLLKPLQEVDAVLGEVSRSIDRVVASFETIEGDVTQLLEAEQAYEMEYQEVQPIQTDASATPTPSGATAPVSSEDTAVRVAQLRTAYDKLVAAQIKLKRNVNNLLLGPAADAEIQAGSVHKGLAGLDTAGLALFLWIGSLYTLLVLFPWGLLLLFLYRKRNSRAMQIYEDLMRLDSSRALIERVLSGEQDNQSQKNHRKLLDEIKAAEASGPVNSATKSEQAKKLAEALAQQAFSNFEYVLTLILLTVLTAVGWYYIFYPEHGAGLAGLIEEGKGILGLTDHIVGNITPITLGFVGAYFYLIQLLVRRYLADDLYPSAFLQAAQRLILVFILSLALQVFSSFLQADAQASGAQASPTSTPSSATTSRTTDPLAATATPTAPISIPFRTATPTADALLSTPTPTRAATATAQATSTPTPIPTSLASTSTPTSTATPTVIVPPVEGGAPILVAGVGSQQGPPLLDASPAYQVDPSSDVDPSSNLEKVLQAASIWGGNALSTGASALFTLTTLLAFFAGIFPSWAVNHIRRGVNDRLKSKIPDMSEAAPLTYLDGVNMWTEARLFEENVENVQSMATAPIEQLVLGTHFSTAQIVDWIDQSLLYAHAGHKGEWFSQLRAVGIRTASDLLDATVLDFRNLDRLRQTDFEPDDASILRVVAAVNSAVDAGVPARDDPHETARKRAGQLLHTVDTAANIADKAHKLAQSISSDKPESYDYVAALKAQITKAGTYTETAANAVTPQVDASLNVLGAGRQQAQLTLITGAIKSSMAEAAKAKEIAVQLSADMTLKPSNLTRLNDLREAVSDWVKKLDTAVSQVRILAGLAEEEPAQGATEETIEAANILRSGFKDVFKALDKASDAVRKAQTQSENLDPTEPETLDATTQLKAYTRQLQTAVNSLSDEQAALREAIGAISLIGDQGKSVSSALDGVDAAMKPVSSKVDNTQTATERLEVATIAATDLSPMQKTLQDFYETISTAQSATQSAVVAVGAATAPPRLTVEIVHVICDTLWPDENMQYVLNFYSKVGMVLA